MMNSFATKFNFDWKNLQWKLMIWCTKKFSKWNFLYLHYDQNQLEKKKIKYRERIRKIMIQTYFLTVPWEFGSWKGRSFFLFSFENWRVSQLGRWFLSYKAAVVKYWASILSIARGYRVEKSFFLNRFKFCRNNEGHKTNLLAFPFFFFYRNLYFFVFSLTYGIRIEPRITI